MVQDLRQAQMRGTLTSRLRVYLRPRLLIVDELTYAPFEGSDATNFFRLVSEHYEHGSTILTANRSYGEWGQVFNDAVLATAILDRLLHHSVTVNIKGGQSYRLKDKGRAGLLPGQAEGGIGRVPYGTRRRAPDRRSVRNLTDVTRVDVSRRGAMRGTRPLRWSVDLSPAELYVKAARAAHHANRATFVVAWHRTRSAA